MEQQEQLKLNSAVMRRHWQQYRQRQYQYRLAARFLIRLSIWILSVYLVRAWDSRAVPCYLLLSIVVLILTLSYGRDEEESYLAAAHLRRRVENSDGANTHPGREGDAENNDNAAAEAPQLGPALRRRDPRSKGDHPANSVSSLDPRVSSGGAGALPESASAPEDDRPEFDGVLQQAQGRALMRAMQQLSTPGATRCAMDAAFRRTLVNTELDDLAACVCGSGAKFGACCRLVKDHLLAILDDT
jgi:hypothetical protein